MHHKMLTQRRQKGTLSQHLFRDACERVIYSSTEYLNWGFSRPVLGS